MKKLLWFILIAACLVACTCFADNHDPALSEAKVNTYGSSVWYTLEPGLYRIGDIIPHGAYDVRIAEGVAPCDIAYSDALTEEGLPDLDNFFSYTVSVYSQRWPGGAHPVVTVDSGGYLLIKWKTCHLYPVPIGY